MQASSDSRLPGRYMARVCSAGIPCISFFDDFTVELKFTRANDTSGEAWGAADVVDDRSNTGWMSSMTLFNDKPVIAYYSLVSGDLGLALAEVAAYQTVIGNHRLVVEQRHTGHPAGI